MTEIRIYYEGSELLKPGFSKFFQEVREKARVRRCSLKFISAGSGSKACRDFGIAIRVNTNAWNILLKDTEGPYTPNLSASLCRECDWDQSYVDSIFWMVEMMEAWFLADKVALEKFYGPGFKTAALKANPKVEEISKSDVKSGLNEATRSTKPGSYFDNKTSHGPKLLEAIDPSLVRGVAPNCERLFRAVLARLG